MDKTISHTGTPNGILAIITTGEVRGIIENQNAIGPSGLSNAVTKTIMAAISGREIGSINCWVSDSLSTAEPIAAKRAAYNKYPKMKKNKKLPIMAGKLMESIELIIPIIISLFPAFS